jgi:hypothetical protein
MNINTYKQSLRGVEILIEMRTNMISETGKVKNAPSQNFAASHPK